jgi:alpha-glucosidase (family GH31 glycosyl hydrolase)
MMRRPRLSVLIGACLAVYSANSAWIASGSTSIRYCGKDAELTINELSDQMVQIVLSPIDEATGQPKPIPTSSALVEQKPHARLNCRSLDKTETLTIGKLSVEVRPDPLTIVIRKASGEVVQELAFPGNDGQMSFQAKAPIFGLGEGAQQFDRRGAVYSMKDGWGAWDRPTFGSWVAVPFLIGSDGWAIFVHSPVGEFDLREAAATFTPWTDQSGTPLVVYVIAWNEPADALREYTRLVGPAPLPPKWALGFMQSHRTLAGPEEVLGVAHTLRDKKLPCDALIYLGTGYCPAGWNTGHASVEFNPKTFDKPEEMIRELHDLNFKIVLHQNAPPRNLTGLEVTHVEAGADEPRPNRRNSNISDYWARHRATFALGVDGWWPDDGDELDHESRIARHRMYYEGPLLDRPNVRPWNLERTGYVGVGRYGGWIWSGDIDSRWKTLTAQVSVGQNHSLSLSPYWGTDVGGFFPTKELTGELYVRWFQFGAFCPSFRAHGRTWHLRLPWGWDTGEPGPIEQGYGPDDSELHNAQVEPICRKYLDLRYQLLGYNYTLCREALDSGLPLIRALWLSYPDDPIAVGRGDEYLWGRDLLVAPVTEKGATTRSLYLPAGDWYDFWTNERHAGAKEIARSVDLETLPLYVRAGAILPLEPVRQYTSEATSDPTTLRIYTGKDGQFRWYNDDGQSLDYQNGKYAWIRFSWSDGKRRLTIEPEGDGTFEVPPKAFEVVTIPDGKRQSVRYENQRIEIKL